MKEASSWGCEEKEDHDQKTLGPHPNFKNSRRFCLAKLKTEIVGNNWFYMPYF
jgi:hypothetical protein